jgi:dihydroxy-acid dehydratase
MEFTTIAVSDGIAMGHEGMRSSLVSRDWIADSVEIMMNAERFDALVTIAGCDKSLPGMLMAAARLNVPSVFLYGGSIAPGAFRGATVTLQDVFEGVGAVTAGRMTEEDLDELERVACPGFGSCAGMYSANTLASAAEALGMSLPLTASVPAVDPRRKALSRASGDSVVRLLERDIRPRDILTREAFENAIAVVSALSGSTNSILHLLAIAAEAEVELDLDTFDRISRRTPHLADLKPSGRYVMRDLDAIGGIPAVMRTLLDVGLLHPDPLTVTGKTVAENLDGIAIPTDQDVLRRPDDPLHAEGGYAVLRGTLAPEGSVVKVAATQQLTFRGPARVFDSEEDGYQALAAGQIRPGDAIVLRYEGPRGGPGMREMFALTGAIHGAGLGDKVLFVTDGRASGGVQNLSIVHVAPEAAVGGPIALVQDGDVIVADVKDRRLDLEVSESDLATRRARWSPPPPRYRSGVLAKYAGMVSSASRGATTAPATT